jgi:hypothetical protein
MPSWVWVSCYDRRLVGQSVLSWAYGQIFITVRQLRVCWYGALSLTRRRVCRLQLLLDLASVVTLGSDSRWTRDHILLSQIRDLHFRRLEQLAGLPWRYSTPPPHGKMSTCYTNSALKTTYIMWQKQLHFDGEGTWDDAIILRNLSKPTFLILKTTEVGLWDYIAVCVSVCESPFQISSSWTNVYEIWNVYKCTWAQLNDVTHISLHQYYQYYSPLDFWGENLIFLERPYQYSWRNLNCALHKSLRSVIPIIHPLKLLRK